MNATIGKDKGKFANVKFVLDNCISTEKHIVTFADKNQIDFYMHSYQRCRYDQKNKGTRTLYIVNNSITPVMLIPSHYRAKNLKKATYLSDFETLKKETIKISKLLTEIF